MVLDKNRIVMIYRPVDEYIKGTGIAAVKYYLKKKLQEEGYEIIEGRKMFGVRPFHSLWSIVVYDIISPILVVLRALKNNPGHIFFVDVTPCLLIGLIRLLSRGATITTLVHAYPEEKALYLSYIRFLTRLAIYFSDNIICTTEENKNRLIEKYSAYKVDKMVVLPLGLTVDEVPNELNALPRPGGPVVIGYLGTSDQRKRLDRLIAVMKFHSEQKIPMKLVTAGPISLFFQEKFVQAASDIVAYEHRGVIKESEKVDFFKDIDIFFFPTAREGFGLPILEAFLYKKPCIVYRSSLIPRILKERCTVCEEDLSNYRTILQDVSENKMDQANMENQQYARTFDWKCYVNFFKHL